MPTTVPSVVLTRPLRLLAASPGLSPTSTIDNESELIPVLLLGGAVPREGMDVQAWPIGGMLVGTGARRCSGGALNYAWTSATCNTPVSVTLTVSKDGSEVFSQEGAGATGSFGAVPSPGEYTVEFTAEYFDTVTRSASFPTCNLVRSVSASMTPTTGTPADEGVLPNTLTCTLSSNFPGTSSIPLTLTSGRVWRGSLTDLAGLSQATVTFTQTSRCGGTVEVEGWSFLIVNPPLSPPAEYLVGAITVSGRSYPSIAMSGTKYAPVGGLTYSWVAASIS